MTTLIIGSTAMAKYLPSRKPKDLDLFTPLSASEIKSSLGADLKVDIFWHPSFEEWLTLEHSIFATLDELYTIKVSHSYWVLENGSWDKHMYDIVELKKAGARLIPDLHKLLYKVWEEKHGKKKVSLQQDKESFFTDAVHRIYDHDSVHLSVAYGNRPLYESVFKDGQNIEMDMNKVKALPFEECVRLYREEIYATALERWVIPSNYRYSPRRAYAKALQKTIASLTKGWSATMLVDHYEIFRDPDMDYVAHHKSKSDQLIKLEN